MSPWLVASGAGLGFALLQYGWRRTHGSLGIVGGGLRLLSVALVVALLLDAPTGAPKPVSNWTALDVSESMQRADASLWRSALDSARATGGDSTLLFGDSVRHGPPATTPVDRRSELRTVSDRALAAGH